MLLPARLDQRGAILACKPPLPCRCMPVTTQRWARNATTTHRLAFASFCFSVHSSALLSSSEPFATLGNATNSMTRGGVDNVVDLCRVYRLSEIIPHTVQCPYCGESFDTSVDTSGGSQRYTEDCYVCCRPIVFTLTLDPDGSLSVETRREED